MGTSVSGWFRRLFALPAVADLRRRVEELERAELDRERITAEQIEQLKKLFKRLRTRDAREADQHDPATTKDALRARLLHPARIG